MDEALIPTALTKICRHDRTGDFTILRYGAKEGSGLYYVVGPLVSVPLREMARRGYAIVVESLQSFRLWPADTIFRAELSTMTPKARSKFVTHNRFVSIHQPNRSVIALQPQHKIGRGWQGITGYPEEAIHLKLPVDQRLFYETLLNVFKIAT